MIELPSRMFCLSWTFEGQFFEIFGDGKITTISCGIRTKVKDNADNFLNNPDKFKREFHQLNNLSRKLLISHSFKQRTVKKIYYIP